VDEQLRAKRPKRWWYQQVRDDVSSPRELDVPVGSVAGMGGSVLGTGAIGPKLRSEEPERRVRELDRRLEERDLRPL
jgi:hypothetical protein